MDLSLLSKYRSELMGLATIWVMLYHFSDYDNFIFFAYCLK